jgi:hypothetical protein
MAVALSEGIRSSGVREQIRVWTGLADHLIGLEVEGLPDTQVSRLSLACSAADGQLATVLGASGYPGPLMVQSHGRRRSPTSRPAQDGRMVSVLLGEA